MRHKNIQGTLYREVASPIWCSRAIFPGRIQRTYTGGAQGHGHNIIIIHMVFLCLTPNMEIKVVHNVALYRLGGAQDNFACSLRTTCEIVYNMMMWVSVSGLCTYIQSSRRSGKKWLALQYGFSVARVPANGYALPTICSHFGYRKSILQPKSPYLKDHQGLYSTNCTPPQWYRATLWTTDLHCAFQ